MAVPVNDPVLESLQGVVVFTHEGGKSFDFSQERLAERLVRDIFARIVASKRSAPQSAEPNRIAEFAYDLSQRFVPTCDPIETTLEVLERLVPETNSKGMSVARRLFALCAPTTRIKEDRLVVLGHTGLLSPKTNKDSYPLQGSITYEAIRVQQRGIVYRALDDKGVWETLHAQKAYTKDAVFEIAIAFENQLGKSLGSILVKSDRFDFEPNELAPYLRVLSYWLSKHPAIATADDVNAIRKNLDKQKSLIH